jgi:hypothetical protein
VNNEFEGFGREQAQRLPAETEENYENQSGYLVFQARIKPSIS